MVKPIIFPDHGQPEGPQPEKKDKKAGRMGTQKPECIMNGFGNRKKALAHTGVRGMITEQADKGEDDKE